MNFIYALSSITKKKNLIHQCFISKAKHVINEVTIVLAVPFAASI